MPSLGLIWPVPWTTTLAWATGGLAILLACSSVADRVATALIAKPPTLGVFRGLQQSKAKLLLGIVAAWIVGGFVEEAALRGIVLQFVEHAAQPAGTLFATAAGILAAAAIAFTIHLYQAARAALIATQLSVLFGLLFVVSGRNLWVTILAHGLYDTIAFIRLARGTSRYAEFVNSPPS